MKIKYLLPTAALTLLAGVAFGGFSNTGSVEIDLDNRLAFGNQLGAKVSDNDIELIGCGIRVFDDGVNPPFSFGFCQAVDSEGVGASCTTTNGNLLDAMKATSAFAFIVFNWDENDECTHIGFSTQSFYIPNTTTKGAN